MTVTDFSALLAPNGVYKYYKEGQWLESSSGKAVKILNPCTGQAVYQVQGEPSQPAGSGMGPAQDL
jgi:hypothetical protein